VAFVKNHGTLPARTIPIRGIGICKFAPSIIKPDNITPEREVQNPAFGLNHAANWLIYPFVIKIRFKSVRFPSVSNFS
jgi:hypothetical protein